MPRLRLCFDPTKPVSGVPTWDAGGRSASMFELGRELKRFFAAERAKAPADGLTGGDSSLLELLDCQLLAQEAKASDIAAGRISAKDKPRRRLEAAIVWREV